MKPAPGEPGGTGLRALVCDIQRFSVHDGPGIRTTIFFKGCPLRCQWCQNPETLKFDNELIFSADRCIACGDCAKACPEKAIRFDRGPIINRKLCNACFVCAETCPSRALEPAAREYSAAELAPLVLADREFYEPEGGVTLSGGEPLSRPAFLRELLPLLKGQGLQAAVQTCGFFKWEEVRPLLDLVDLVLYDLKAATPELHQLLTGKDNRLILDNLKKLIADRVPHQVRMPIVPTKNDRREELIKVARLLLELAEPEIWLLPYHRLGETKLKKLESELKPLGLNAPGEKEIRAYAQVFLDAGLRVKSFALTFPTTAGAPFRAR